MPALIALAGIIAAAAFWYYRARDTADMAGDLVNAANDVRLAARRFGYKKKMNVHPADAVDDARIAAVGIVLAFAQSEHGGVRRDDLDATTLQAQSVFGVDKGEADGLVAVGSWINDQTRNPSEVVRRLQRRLKLLAGGAAEADLLQMISRVAGPLSQEGDEMQAQVVRALRG